MHICAHVHGTAVCQVLAGDLQEALNFITFLRDTRGTPMGVKMKAEFYRTLLQVFKGSGEWKSAAFMIEVMKQDEVEPDISTYTTISTVCAERGKWESCVSIIDLLQRQKLSVNRHHYHLVLLAWYNVCQGSTHTHTHTHTHKGWGPHTWVGRGVTQDMYGWLGVCACLPLVCGVPPTYSYMVTRSGGIGLRLLG
jgi:hypothetical protein